MSGGSEGPAGLFHSASVHDTLAQKLRAAESLDLTAEQRTKFRERLVSSAQKHREQRRARHELAEAEFKAIGEVLTAEQREKARHYIERRLVTAPIVQSVTERLQAAADKLGLTAEQGRRIVDTHKNFDEKYEKLADDRREVMQSEPKAVGEILTPEQRDRVRNDFQDHVVSISRSIRTTHRPRPCSRRRSRSGSRARRRSWV